MTSDSLLLLLGALVLAAVIWLNRRGPRPPSPRGGGPLVVALLLLPALLGCGNALRDARVAVGSAADLYNAAEPRAEAAEKRALDGCFAAPVPLPDRPTCVDRVVEQWAPVKAALTALDGAIHAARGALLLADAAAVTGAPVDVEALARQVADVLRAAAELQRLTAPAVVAAPAPKVP